MAKKDERKRVSEARKADVDAKLATLRGLSRAELEADDRRGAASPLGHGTGSIPIRKGKRR